MNTAFHAVTGIATGAALAGALPAGEGAAWLEKRDTPFLLAGLSLNVILHGLLDVLPHTYPLSWWSDIALSLALLALALVVVSKRYWLLLVAAFLGAMLPDLIDLGPPLLNHVAGFHLPTWEVFPWHWSQFSGSMYSSDRDWLSLADHLLVLAACAGLLFVTRKRWAHILRSSCFLG